MFIMTCSFSVQTSRSHACVRRDPAGWMCGGGFSVAHFEERGASQVPHGAQSRPRAGFM